MRQVLLALGTDSRMRRGVKGRSVCCQSHRADCKRQGYIMVCEVQKLRRTAHTELKELMEDGTPRVD